MSLYATAAYANPYGSIQIMNVVEGKILKDGTRRTEPLNPRAISHTVQVPIAYASHGSVAAPIFYGSVAAPIANGSVAAPIGTVQYGIPSCSSLYGGSYYTDGYNYSGIIRNPNTKPQYRDFKSQGGPKKETFISKLFKSDASAYGPQKYGYGAGPRAGYGYPVTSYRGYHYMY